MEIARVWIWLSAWTCSGGWVLSALGWLNGYGWTAWLTPAVVLALWHVLQQSIGRTSQSWRRTVARCRRRLLPALFLGCAALSFVGAALYVPSNYDLHTYRLPRVFNWLNHGGWFWIDTNNIRMNLSGTAADWILTPLLLMSELRILFLPSAVAFLILPSLFFVTARHLGLHGRVAWTWMWAFPCAYCFVMQAGSAGNDLQGAAFGLAAMAFALRSRSTQNETDLLSGMLAAALCTGTKLSNCLFLLPFAVAAWPARHLLISRIRIAVPVLAMGVLASAIPLVALNTSHTGHWTGDPSNEGLMRLGNPVAGLAGNTLQAAVGNMALPVLPSAGAVAAKVQGWLPERWAAWLRKEYPRFHLYQNEVPNEEWVGLGMPVCLLILTMLFPRCDRPRAQPEASTGVQTTAVCLSTWMAVVGVMCLLGSEAITRLLIPYYPVLVMCFLRGDRAETWCRSRLYKKFVVLAMASALIPLVLTPSRPLWPAERVLTSVQEGKWFGGSVSRAREVYRVYASRADALAPLRKAIPEHIREIGFLASSDDLETALWFPLGAHVVRHIPMREIRNREWFTRSGVKWVVVRPDVVEREGMSWADWLSSVGGNVVANGVVTMKVREGPVKWAVVEVGAECQRPGTKEPRMDFRAQNE